MIHTAVSHVGNHDFNTAEAVKYATEVAMNQTVGKWMSVHGWEVLSHSTVILTPDQRGGHGHGGEVVVTIVSRKLKEA